MSKEKLYGLRDQLSKYLYDPTPEQSAQRDKMWDEGRFEEIFKDTKRKEEQLEYIEKRIEAVEAAEPEIGEKIATNIILNLPWGRAGKGAGLGSLLGSAEEEMGAADAQRLKDIEQQLYQLNAERQQEANFMRPSSLKTLDDRILNLQTEAKNINEAAGIMPLIGDTPTTGEAGPPSPPSGPPSPPSGGDGNGGPTREDVLKYINTLSLKERLGAYTPYGELYDEEIFQYEDLLDWDKDVVDWENIPADYRSEGQELARAFLEKHQIQEKFETDLVKDFTYRGQSQPYFEDVDMDKIRVRVPRQGTDYGSGAKYSQKTFTNPTYGELKEWFAGLEQGPKGIVKPRSYQGGGLVMNYGDYGRSYK